MNLAHPMSYMGPMPWYWQVWQSESEWYEELRIFMEVHHVHLPPLDLVVPIGLVTIAVGLALARKR